MFTKESAGTDAQAAPLRALTVPTTSVDFGLR